LGGYFLNLTRDDFGGLRYIYRHNNYNNERLSPDASANSSAQPWQPLNFSGTNSASTNTFALRGGVEKIQFMKTRYDSLLGRFFKPVILNYTVPVITNFHLINQKVRRVILQPDLIFAAADITGTIVIPLLDRSVSFITNGNPNVNIGGPGVIAPQMLVTFNKVGPFFLNQTEPFLDEITATKGFIWGSFDGSTNVPIVYPSGTSIKDLERNVLSH